MIAGPRTRPKLIALDLDGTLIGRDLRISRGVMESVAQARKAGVQSAIVTGRMFQAARPFAHTLELDGPIVCYQGAAIYDLHSGDRLFHLPVARELALRVLARTNRDGVQAQLYLDDQLYVEEMNRLTKLYTDLAQVQAIVVPSLAAELERRDTTKLVLVMDTERVPAYLEVVQAVAGSDGYVTRSQPEYIEVVNPAVNKGKALAFVAERLGVPLEATLAVGDSWNDLPLLKAAGFGVAMGSAPPELRAAADAVVADVANDGVREAIERYVLT